MAPIPRGTRLRELLLFGASGALSTAVAYVTFPLFYLKVFGSDHFIAALACSAVINVSVSFLLQRIFVFRSRGRWMREYLQFWVGASIVAAAAYAVLYLFVRVMAWDATLANAVVVTVSAIASFAYHQSVTFARRHARDASEAP